MITDLKKLWLEAFEDPAEVVDGFFGTGFSSDRCRRLYANDRLACALYWFDVFLDNRKLAYIYGVATDKQMRSQGYGRRLMHHAHQQLKRQGYSGAVLVPGNAGLFAFYEKLGYKTCCKISEFSCQASSPVPVRQLDLCQFALARRKKLPKGSVLQEGATLSFLNTYYRFWAGEDWVLAGTVTQGTLYVQEFLGDAALAPAITAALGAQKGRFRTPGTDRPFAMHYGFDDAPAPKYFGLAMD